MDVSLLTVTAAVLGVSLSVPSDAAPGLNKESATRRVHTVFKAPPSSSGGMRHRPRTVSNDIGNAVRDTTTAVYDSTKNGIQEVGNRLGGATDELTGGFFSGSNTQPATAPATSMPPPPGTLPQAGPPVPGASNAFAQNSLPQPTTGVDPRYGNAAGVQPVPVANPGGYPGYPGWPPDPAAQGRATQVGATQTAGATQNVLPPNTNSAQDPGSNPFGAGGPQFPEQAGRTGDTRSVLVGPPPPNNDAWNTPISATTSGNNEPPPPGGRQSFNSDLGGARRAPASNGNPDDFVPLRRVNESNANQRSQNTNQGSDPDWGADSWRRDNSNSTNWSGNSSSNFGGDGDLPDNRSGWPARPGGGASPGSWPAWPNAQNPNAAAGPSGGMAANPSATGWDANWPGQPGRQPSGAVTTAGLPPGAVPGTTPAINPPAAGNSGLLPGGADVKAPAREAWVPLLAVSTALIGSLGANLFLGFSYMDARHRYLSAIRRATRFGTRRD